MQELSEKPFFYAIFGRTSFCIIFLCTFLFSSSFEIVNSVIYPYILMPWGAALAFSNIKINGIKKNKSTVFFLLFILWYVLLGAYHYFLGKAALDFTIKTIWLYIILFFVFYNYNDGKNSDKSLKNFKIIMGFFTILAALMTLYALYIAFSNTSTTVGNANVGMMWFYHEQYRLAVFMYYNASAELCLIACLLSIYLLREYKGILRFIYSLCFIILLFGVILTQSHTCNVLLSVSFGIYFGFIISNKINIKNRTLRLLLSMFIVLIITFGSYNLIKVSYKELNDNILQIDSSQDNISENINEKNIVYNSYSNIITVASADQVTNEKTPEIIAPTRSLLYNLSSLTGRTSIWKSAIQLLINEPITFLTGTFDGYATISANKYCLNDKHFLSLHNSYLNVLIAYGVIGLILFIGFLFFNISAVYKCFINHIDKKNSHISIIPIIIFCILVIGFVETNFPSSFTSQNYLLFILLGYCYNVSKSNTEKIQN